MKKTGFFRGMFDGLRSTVSQPSSSAKALLEAEFEDNLKPSNFQVKTIVRHGFPYQPTAIAYDPIQRLIAIGTKNGSLRILGRPGVDISVRHVTEFSVLQIIFIINEGQLITICADDSLHLWNLRNKNLEIVHTLKFQKERITYCHMTFQSKWLYIGTERGNIYVVNIDTFVLSGYVINWNKAIELSRKTHPGSIIHLSDCPFDSNKLLIGYESGTIVLWDLRNKCADFRHCYTEGIQSISWHSEGRQFICSHNNGSLSTWTAKASKPASSIFPHSKSIATDYKPEPCSPIPKVEWRTVRNGDAYIMFSGGLPIDSGGSGTGGTGGTGGAAGTGTGVSSKQILTVIYGKSTTVLEMEHDIVDFITLCESPYEADYNDPYAIVVLLSNDLVVVDLQTPGYPCFLNPYPMDLHESPVTYCYYLADCPPDLVRAFFTVGHKLNKRVGYSTREWPINGGEWGSSTVSYPEIIITGHADGSLKFWDASSVNLQVLYKLKTPKLFEKPKVSSNNGNSSSQSDNAIAQESEDPFAIEFLIFSAENRTLCVAGACSQVIVFRFSKQDVQSEIAVIEVPMNYDELEPQADAEIHSGTAALLYQASAPEVHDNSVYYPLKARTGHHKRLSGFQAEIVCVSPWIDRKTPPYRITSMCHNVHASLLAYGTENSVVIIDQIQKSIVLNVSTSSLYGTSDPYPRVSGKQKRCTSAGPYSKEGDNNGISEAERCRSPITESSSVVAVNEDDDDDDDLFLIEPPQTPVSVSSANLVLSGPMTPVDLSLPTSPTSVSSMAFQSPSSSAMSSPQTSNCPSNFVSPVPSTSQDNPVDSSQFALIDTSLFPPLNEFSTLPEVDSVPSPTGSLESPVPGLKTVFNFNPEDVKCEELSKPALETVISQPQPTIEACPKPPPRRKRSKLFGFRRTESASTAQLPTSLTSNTITELKEFKEPTTLEQTTELNTSSLADQSPSSVISVEVALEATELKQPPPPPPPVPDCPQQLSPIPPKEEATEKDQLPAASPLQDSLDNSSLSCPTDSAPPSISSCGISSINSSTPQQQPHSSYVGWERFSRYKHHKLVDLSNEEVGSPNSDTFVGRIFNKLDSFTRSRSSSMSSLENVGNESIQFLSFANTFVNKNDTAPSPTLWVGTSCGSVIVVSLTMPDSVDNRILCLQTVIATPSPTIFRLKGTILNIGFLDANGNQLPLNPDQWKDRSRPENTTPAPSSVESKRTGSLTITRTGSGGTPSRQPKISPTSSAADVRDSHFVVLTSEKQIRLLVMPLQACAQKATITETSFAVRADIVSMKSHDALCLAAYLGTGNIVVYSLPSLHLLIDIDFLPLTDVRIARTIFFSTNGHGMYLSSPSELTKFTISSNFCENLADMVGTVYNGPKDLPEQPKQSFLKGLFGGAPSPLDREELFGENSSGKASKTTARLIPGSMEHAKANTSNLGGEFAKLREGFNERGERLGKLEDKTALMQNEAEAFSSVAHAVMLKYRDKKWYQF